MSYDLPPDADALLGRQVRSLEELEVVVYLHNAGRSCHAQEIAVALRLPEAATVTALQGLVLNRLVVQTGSSSPLLYVLAAEDELRAAVAGLARAYEANRVEVIVLVSERAIQRLRSGVLKMFSDSFRITRKNDG